MTRTTRTAMVFLVFAQGLAGCDHRSTPPGPAPVPQPAPQPTGIQVSGHVSDSAFRPVAGATVEVVDGPDAGKATTSRVDGSFTLTGRFDAATSLRAVKEGYVPSTQTFRPNYAGILTWLFRLALVGQPIDISGDYTLTIIVDDACNGMPDELRSRTYAAFVTPTSSPDHPSNTLFKVDVSGAPLVEKYKSFFIGVAGDYLGFALYQLDDDWGFVEQVAANKFLAFYGTAGASIAPTISTSLNADIYYCTLKTETGSFTDCNPRAAPPCSSKNHRLVFTRR